MTTTKDDVKRQFGANAEKYAASKTHALGSDLHIILSYLDPQPHMHVLDVATGAGHTAAMIAPFVAHVTASDLSPEMIEQASKQFAAKGLTNADAVVADVEALDFDDSSFDAVTCRIAPHHFLDINKAIAEIARVLKPGGMFILEDSVSPPSKRLDRYVNSLEKLRDPTHIRAYTKREWRRMLIEAGFRVARCEIYRKTHNIEDWMGNSGCSDELKKAVRAMLVQAPSAAKEHYAIEIADGVPISFTDDKLILKAVKR
ncbi:MAG: class I SAM-dependent methyltransferase [Candidatus Obscuribacterales bacterium]|nr:class I SAM-dependent methyltransferase [Candidatus Obscuribacterales bacterium]